jgi:hypothetical protein
MKIISTLIIALVVSANANAKCPCKDDIKKSCPNLQKEERKTCILANKAKFSKECQEMMTAKEEIKVSCAADFQKFCENAKGKEKKACAIKNKDKFSDSCKKAQEKMKTCKGKKAMTK